MAQIKIEVTSRRKRILEALCLKQGVTMEALFEGKMLDLEMNAAGLDITESDEDQEAHVASFERKATRADTERKAAKAAQTAATPTTQEKA